MQECECRHRFPPSFARILVFRSHSTCGKTGQRQKKGRRNARVRQRVPSRLTYLAELAVKIRHDRVHEVVSARSEYELGLEL